MFLLYGYYLQCLSQLGNGCWCVMSSRVKWMPVAAQTTHGHSRHLYPSWRQCPPPPALISVYVAGCPEHSAPNRVHPGAGPRRIANMASSVTFSDLSPCPVHMYTTGPPPLKCVLQSRTQLHRWRTERSRTERGGVWVICCLSGFNGYAHILIYSVVIPVSVSFLFPFLPSLPLFLSNPNLPYSAF